MPQPSAIILYVFPHPPYSKSDLALVPSSKRGLEFCWGRGGKKNRRRVWGPQQRLLSEMKREGGIRKGRGGKAQREEKKGGRRGWLGGGGLGRAAISLSISPWVKFSDYIVGLQSAITVRSAFSLRYIMTHAENVIKILWWFKNNTLLG